MVTLKQKTIAGLSWTFFDKFANQIIQFIIGIILARLLTPKEYGLTGMVSIFLAVSNVFITSGFGEALVRKTNATSDDYSTIFIFNFIVSVVCYLLLFLFADSIAVFFNESYLKDIIIVLSLTLIINALSLMPRTFLWKKMDFKSLSIISISSTVLSGIFAITLAYFDYGVWSLVWRSLTASIIGVILLYLLSTIKIKLTFNKSSFMELFGFSSKLLISQLINQIFQNIYALVIAKFFSARELGLYSRADQYKDLPSRTLDQVIQSVSFPVLAEIKEDTIKLKSAYKRLIKSTMLLTFFLMLGMAATADNLILGLIGEKWRETIPYLQLLSFVGMFYPLHSLNLNMLNVLGRSDLFLRLEIIKKILVVPIIIIGIYFGIKIMILGILANTIFAYYLNSYYSGKFIDYPIFEQIMDILPAFFLSTFTASIVFFTGALLNFQPLISLSIQIAVGLIIFLAISEIFKIKDYFYLKSIVIEKILKR